MYIHAGATLIIALNYSSSLSFPQEIGVARVTLDVSSCAVSPITPPSTQISPSLPSRQENADARSVNGKSSWVWDNRGTISRVRLLKRCLQAMERAPGDGGRCRFTRVGSQIDAAVDGVVVLVGRRGLSGVLPGGLVVHVGVVYERNVGRRVLYSKLRVSHEIVDGGSGFGFFQAFVERATKCVHDAYLREEKNSVTWLNAFVEMPQRHGGKVIGERLPHPLILYCTVHWHRKRKQLKDRSLTVKERKHRQCFHVPYSTQYSIQCSKDPKSCIPRDKHC